MQKYKIVASKSQKKYTIIVSADSETEAKEKIHKEDYSILSVSQISEAEIKGQKFIFQVEIKGDIKNGIIVGKDIFKVYIKLRDEMGYKIIFLYPEGDEAHNNAEKKQKIMSQLEHWYEMQKQTQKIQTIQKENDEKFYHSKELQQTQLLVEKVLSKLDSILTSSSKAWILSEQITKLTKIYEKLIHMRGSTNVEKLKEISELALLKIGEIELQIVESNKDTQSRELLQETNDLLKKIGSNKKYIEADKDFKKIIKDFVSQFHFDSSWKKDSLLKKKESLIDTKSYSFLKTLLLLEKYKEKKKANSKEIHKNFILFLNPLNKSELKEKLILKRKVIEQNISILKAKKNGTISSYTSVKKGYKKTVENMYEILFFQSRLFFILFLILLFFFILSLTLSRFAIISVWPQAHLIIWFLLLLLWYYFCISSKNLSLLSLNIVFFFFIFIFFRVNF